MSTLRLLFIRQNRPADWEPCPKLMFDISTRLPICNVHGEEKPVVCSKYPLSPAETIFGGCGFKFIPEAQP